MSARFVLYEFARLLAVFALGFLAYVALAVFV